MPDYTEEEYYDDELDAQCEYCGRNLNGYDSGVHACPSCCSSIYAAGSEECDWCPYSDECYELYYPAEKKEVN